MVEDIIDCKGGLIIYDRVGGGRKISQHIIKRGGGGG